MCKTSLSRYAGLYCTVLTGFAKGLDYRPGDKFKGTHLHLFEVHKKNYNIKGLRLNSLVLNTILCERV